MDTVNFLLVHTSTADKFEEKTVMVLILERFPQIHSFGQLCHTIFFTERKKQPLEKQKILEETNRTRQNNCNKK